MASPRAHSSPSRVVPSIRAVRARSQDYAKTSFLSWRPQPAIRTTNLRVGVRSSDLGRKLRRLRARGESPKLLRAVETPKFCRSGTSARVARVLLVSMLLACNAPSKDGLFSRAGAGGILGSGGTAGSGDGSGGSDSGGEGGTAGQGLGGMGAAGQGGEGAGGSSGLDGGIDAADSAPPEPDAAPVCTGTLVGELCWHLGELGDSCVDTCASRGGYDDRGTSIIGSDAQGGSLAQCTVILETLLGEEANTNDDNSNDAGVGCHLRGDDEDRVWLEEADFAPDESDTEARIACSCAR
jgi:hypothetical protein